MTKEEYETLGWAMEILNTRGYVRIASCIRTVLEELEVDEIIEY